MNQATAISGISVTESPAIGGETFTVTVADTGGVLTATGTEVSGAGTTSLTVTGSLSQVNRDLATLTDTEANTASDMITINAADSYGGKAGPNQIVVTVEGPPVVTVPVIQTLQHNQATAISGISVSETGAAGHETFKVVLGRHQWSAGGQHHCSRSGGTSPSLTAARR